MFFINDAWADTVAAQGATSQQGGGFSAILMLVVFIALIYFLIWRPQSKRAKEQRNLIGAVKAGDEVVTVGGLYGKVIRVEDSFFEIEIAKGVTSIFQRSAVSHMLPKGTIK